MENDDDIIEFQHHMNKVLKEGNKTKPKQLKKRNFELTDEDVEKAYRGPNFIKDAFFFDNCRFIKAIVMSKEKLIDCSDIESRGKFPPDLEDIETRILEAFKLIKKESELQIKEIKTFPNIFKNVHLPFPFYVYYFKRMPSSVEMCDEPRDVKKENIIKPLKRFSYDKKRGIPQNMYSYKQNIDDKIKKEDHANTKNARDGSIHGNSSSLRNSCDRVRDGAWSKLIAKLHERE